MDFTGAVNQYQTSKDGAAADALALWHDWQAVGDDMREAFQEFESTRD